MTATVGMNTNPDAPPIAIPWQRINCHNCVHSATRNIDIIYDVGIRGCGHDRAKPSHQYGSSNRDHEPEMPLVEEMPSNETL